MASPPADPRVVISHVGREHRDERLGRPGLRRVAAGALVSTVMSRRHGLLPQQRQRRGRVRTASHLRRRRRRCSFDETWRAPPACNKPPDSLRPDGRAYHRIGCTADTISSRGFSRLQSWVLPHGCWRFPGYIRAEFGNYVAAIRSDGRTAPRAVFGRARSSDAKALCRPSCPFRTDCTWHRSRTRNLRG